MFNGKPIIMRYKPSTEHVYLEIMQNCTVPALVCIADNVYEFKKINTGDIFQMRYVVSIFSSKNACARTFQTKIVPISL